MKILIMIGSVLLVPISHVVGHTNNFVENFVSVNASYIITKNDVLQIVTPINVTSLNTLPSNHLFTNYPIKDNHTLIFEASNGYSDSKNNHHNKEIFGNNQFVGRLPKNRTSVKKENNE